MNRLQAEFRRLYLPLSSSTPSDDSRAMVLELARPADWALLSQVWRGVQSDLALPAPAIAASGTEGLQLWFSLAEAVPVTQAQAFLSLLCQRYGPDVAATRWRLMPAVQASPDAGAPGQAPWVPALQPSSGNWSAFVAPDLAPLFAETPWIDVPPGDDGQAQLLGSLASIQAPLFDAALQQLQATTAPTPAHEPPTASGAIPAAHRRYAKGADPKQFLLAVMNDDSAPLALRIEAAKALLPCAAAPEVR